MYPRCISLTKVILSPSCTKVFGRHTFYEVGGGGGSGADAPL